MIHVWGRFLSHKTFLGARKGKWRANGHMDMGKCTWHTSKQQPARLPTRVAGQQLPAAASAYTCAAGRGRGSERDAKVGGARAGGPTIMAATPAAWRLGSASCPARLDGLQVLHQAVEVGAGHNCRQAGRQQPGERQGGVSNTKVSNRGAWVWRGQATNVPPPPLKHTRTRAHTHTRTHAPGS